MKISVKRSGGFLGEVMDLGNFDTEQLNPELAGQLENDLKDHKFFEMTDSVPVGAIGADMFQYEVTISDESRSHRVTFVDDGGPESSLLRTIKGRLGMP